MWKNRLAYGLVLLTAAVLLFLYSKPFLLTVLIVLLLLMVINGVLVLHDAHSIRVSMRVRPGGQQGKDVNLNIIVNSDKKLLAAQEIFLELETQSTLLGTKKERRFFASAHIGAEQLHDQGARRAVRRAALFLQTHLRARRAESL
jgi:hypothetical protein